MRARFAAAVVVCLAFFSLPLLAAEKVDYMAVFLDGKKIGHSISKQSSDDGKVASSTEMSITISRGPMSVNLTVSESSLETEDGKPLEFTSVMDMGIMAQTAQGKLGPDGKWKLTQTSGGQTRTSDLQWPAGAMLSHGLRLAADKQGYKPGVKYTVKGFDSSSQSAVEMAISIGEKTRVDLLGRVVELYEVKTTMTGKMGAVPSVSYVDDKGEMLKTTTEMMGMKLQMVACDKAVALAATEPVELMSKVVLASPAKLSDAANAKAVVYELAPSGSAAKLGDILSDENQTVRPGKSTTTVTVKPLTPPTGAGFPYKGTDKALLEAIKPNSVLQSDDPKVVELARKAVGDTRDAAEACLRIQKFVHEYITGKDLSVGYATASEVAISREGDCTEHAVLAAAMCRALGIPAEVAVGVAYVPEFLGQKDVFGPHAWYRANVGGKWVYYDAALPGGYDALHLCLTSGDGTPGNFFGIVNTLGQFTIKSVTVDGKPVAASSKPATAGAK
jgi:hypothetical protein